MSRIFLLLLLIPLSGCFNLDADLLNPGPKITAYSLASYNGTVDFSLDSAYTLPPKFVNLFSLESQGIGESSPTTIYVAYLGDTTRIAQDTIIVYCHGYDHNMDFYYPRAQL